jgi:L-threonylcarbamoyladenylate synthase
MQSPYDLTMDISYIQKASEALAAGELVGIPTETVYGLAAAAENPQAIQKIYTVKGRPANHPLILHLPDISHITQWAIDIPDIVWPMAELFWPGPLTVILRKHPHASPAITGQQDSIAIRIPRHPLTLTLLNYFGSAVVAPSANRYGRISPTTATHVQEELGEHLAYILDGGPCEIGIESTIISLLDPRPVILRQGHIMASDLMALFPEISQNTASTLRVPGAVASHYAPEKPLFLKQDLNVQAIPKHIGILSHHPKPHAIPNMWLHCPPDPIHYARMLYAHLRHLDHAECREIWVECPPQLPAWQAIWDRLTRASTK